MRGHRLISQKQALVTSANAIWTVLSIKQRFALSIATLFLALYVAVFMESSKFKIHYESPTNWDVDIIRLEQALFSVSVYPGQIKTSFNRQRALRTNLDGNSNYIRTRRSKPV